MVFTVDPDGDTVITLQGANDHPSSPGNTEKIEKEAASGSRFLVSKKHLMLASRRAGKVLGGSFAEATPKEDGRFHWTFEPIFNPKAFEIVMKIIHGHTRDVPVRINVALLAQISAIVDDLECHNAVWFFAKRWLSQAQDLIPRDMCEDLMRWILISFVFEEPVLFNEVTATAIRHSTHVVPAFNLPIRPKILEYIELHRKHIFTVLFSNLFKLQALILGQSLGCNQGCRAMMLGTFSQGIASCSLSLRPLSPFASLTISSTLETLRAIKTPDYYCAQEDCIDETKSGLWLLQDKPLPRKQTESSSNEEEKAPMALVRHACRLEDHLKRLLDTIDAGIRGLDLARYSSI